MAKVTVTSNLPELAAAVKAAGTDVVGAIGKQIATEARQRASARIGATIVFEHDEQTATATVGAGDDRRAIHAGFEEFGTVGRPAYPFLIPAVEAVRPKVADIAAKQLQQAARRLAV